MYTDDVPDMDMDMEAAELEADVELMMTLAAAEVRVSAPQMIGYACRGGTRR